MSLSHKSFIFNRRWMLVHSLLCIIDTMTIGAIKTSHSGRLLMVFLLEFQSHAELLYVLIGFLVKDIQLGRTMRVAGELLAGILDIAEL